MKPTDLPFPTDIIKFIGFMVANGATIAVLLEQWPWFQKLSAKAKSLGVFALTVIIIPALGVLGQQAIHALPPEQVATIQGYLDFALFGLYSYTTTQVAHGLNPLRTKTVLTQQSTISTTDPLSQLTPEQAEAVALIFQQAGLATSQPVSPPAVVATESVTTTTSNPPEETKSHAPGPTEVQV